MQELLLSDKHEEAAECVMVKVAGLRRGEVELLSIRKFGPKPPKLLYTGTVSHVPTPGCFHIATWAGIKFYIGPGGGASSPESIQFPPPWLVPQKNTENLTPKERENMGPFVMMKRKSFSQMIKFSLRRSLSATANKKLTELKLAERKRRDDEKAEAKAEALAEKIKKAESAAEAKEEAGGSQKAAPEEEGGPEEAASGDLSKNLKKRPVPVQEDDAAEDGAGGVSKKRPRKTQAAGSSSSSSSSSATGGGEQEAGDPLEAASSVWGLDDDAGAAAHEEPEGERDDPMEEDEADDVAFSEKMASVGIPQEVRMDFFGLEFDHGSVPGNPAAANRKSLGLGRYKIYREMDPGTIGSSTCSQVKDARNKQFVSTLKETLPEMSEKTEVTRDDRILGERKDKYGAYKFMWR